MKNFTCLLLSVLIFATPILAQNPCEDSTYLELKKKKLDEMSDREYEFFMQSDKACKEYKISLPQVKKTEPYIATETDNTLYYLFMVGVIIWIAYSGHKSNMEKIDAIGN